MIAIRRAPLLLALTVLAAQPAAAQVAPTDTPVATVAEAVPAQEPAGNSGTGFAEKAAIVGGAIAASVVAFKGLSALFKKKAPAALPPPAALVPAAAAPTPAEAE